MFYYTLIVLFFVILFVAEYIHLILYNGDRIYRHSRLRWKKKNVKYKSSGTSHANSLNLFFFIENFTRKTGERSCLTARLERWQNVWYLSRHNFTRERLLRANKCVRLLPFKSYIQIYTRMCVCACQIYTQDPILDAISARFQNIFSERTREEF